jgi:predicted nucleic acid-binding protein
LVIVVDSSVWIAKFRGHSNEATLKLDAIEDPLTIIVGDVILLELLQGARDEARATEIERRMRLFRRRRMMTGDMAVKAAANYRKLRRRGITVRTSIDLIIATYCLEQNLQLLHHNRDFSAMSDHLGLMVA